METQTQHREAVETAVATVFQSSLPEQAIFRKEGEYWAIGYRRKSSRLKDTKGLGYLAHLLRHPGAEFHVLDLRGELQASARTMKPISPCTACRPGNRTSKRLGSISGVWATRARCSTSKPRSLTGAGLSELREELEEAKEVGNVDRAEKAEQEIDALTSELSRAVGLGGRNRRAASASERARQSIAKTIKSVLDRIAQSDATLGIFCRDA